MKCVYNAPMALDATLSHTRGMEPEAAKVRHRRRIQDLMQAIVGPIPVQNFLDGFFPRHESWDKCPAPSPCKHAFKLVPSHAATEEALCGPLVSSSLARRATVNTTLQNMPGI